MSIWNPFNVSNIFNDYVTFKILGSSYAACCVGEWDAKCWDDRGDYNFNHACQDCGGPAPSPCSSQCQSSSSEACKTCCRTVTHEVDWKCNDAAGKI